MVTMRGDGQPRARHAYKFTVAPAKHTQESWRRDVVRIDGEIVINRPVDEVFDFVADERNEPRFNPRMRLAEQISDGPIGVGTRFRAEMVSMGRTVEMVVEFTGYERPRRLASMTYMSSMDIRYILMFEPVPEGTRMGWSGDLEPRGLLKLMSPLVARIGQRQEERIWTGLKHLLEGRGPMRETPPG
jgi:carbon monoxide dehydrogenase subunit G